MHPAEIQAALKLRGYSQAAIAAECDVKPSTVSMVINGRGRSRPIEERISDVLKLPLGKLWPLWYEQESVGSAPPNAGLTDDELVVLNVYRSMSAAQQKQARAMLQVLSLGGTAQGASTVISGSQRIAGNNYFERVDVSSKKPKK